MRNELALVIHENEAGDVRVQMLGDYNEAPQSFRNLHGKPGDPPSRVTMVTINFGKKDAAVRMKSLPVKGAPKEEQPDGIVLGQGPVWLDK